MKSLVALIPLLALAACAGAPAPAVAPPSTAPVAAPLDLRAALAAPARAATDRARDAGRRPADVVAFLGIGPGMQVIDLIAAGGYYTEVLSLAVGPKGTVYAQNPPFVLKFRDGANDRALTARLADGRLPNVVRLDQGLENVALAPGSLDAAVTALNFHDLYNRDPASAAGFLAGVRRLLKPGGVFGLIDHAGNAGADNAKLHRIEEARVVEAVQSAGFVIEARSDVLRHPDDDRSTQVFDPAIRGKTDRFVLKLRNPE